MLSLLLTQALLPSELLRENKRMLDKAIRELDRERMGLQNQEKKLVGEIKKMAKQGQMVRPACSRFIGSFWAKLSALIECMNGTCPFTPAHIAQGQQEVLANRTLSRSWQSPWSGIAMQSPRCMASSPSYKQCPSGWQP